ncbi:sulfate transport system permease protein CysT [Bacillus sp. JCM 19046]|uniref:Sulfate transport system permease protein CysT n=1 Tax=Shouchella xiaoxiensis TaxID=766895 RepID=A0ABS2SUI1_9BACI|nr:sulfate ABC transporter permease subunit CysT [Shouchella xiaoxiensis]MBM7838831.1 sulfate transport system permease protein [Shouchella xiaoxiensis]GAF15074.1 sulfate transport system permease protein CysT [Bacillus sp. JCM 19045]GAF19945.1 sulfate transport system permease protein CysT [Bacillus sp. JCM 19046]
MKRVLPGFGISLGFTLLYLSFIVLIPLAALLVFTVDNGWETFWNALNDPRVFAAFRLSFTASFIAALINGIFGLLIAWVLVRYSFPGKRIMDGMIDLPFALPTAVAGIALTSLYTESGWIGSLLAPLGIQVAFTPLGVTIALTFIGLPFVVRMVEPVLKTIQQEQEEASALLGASSFQTFRKIIFPVLAPALLTGMTLAFARALGEYGSVVFIAGNMPMRTEIVPLLIMTKLEQFDYGGATAIALVMLILSFALLLLVNAFQWVLMRKLGQRRIT